jgi:hypothetical protein
MWPAYEREKVNAGIRLESLRERNHLKHLSIGGMILLK